MKLVHLQKVFSDGQHNAFTSLAWYRDRFHLAFRNASHHGNSSVLGPSYGKQILLTSEDGGVWKQELETVFPAPDELPCGTLMDFRDNYFLNVGHELQLYSFVSAPLGPDGEYLIPSASTVQATKDGRSWSNPRMIFPGAILWKPILLNGEWLCAGYRRVKDSGLQVDLYHSPDGQLWMRKAPITEGNETCLHAVSDACLRAYVRTETSPCHLKVIESHAPFTQWRSIGVIPRIIRGPHVFSLDGRLILIGREVISPASTDRLVTPGSNRTKIWEVNGAEVRTLLELPSLGDTGYAGVVQRPDGLLLVSYYSQHERESDLPEDKRGGNDKPSDIFVALIDPA